MHKYYVLRNDSGSDGQFNTLATPFDDEKEAYIWACAQCLLFPLSVFVLCAAEKEYQATVMAP